MRATNGSVLAVLWVLLGAGILVSSAIHAWDLALSEFAHKVGIWMTNLFFTLFGLGAIFFGWRITTASLWTKVLGNALCAFGLLYTCFMLAITPDRTIVRPLLALQISVIALAAWTIVYLWRTPRPTARNLEQ